MQSVECGKGSPFRAFLACLGRGELWISLSLTPDPSDLPRARAPPPAPSTLSLVVPNLFINHPSQGWVVGVPAPFWEDLVTITPLNRKLHGFPWVATFPLTDHLPVPGQMVSVLVSLLHGTFSFLLCSSFYCWSPPSPQSGSCLIVVWKPTVTQWVRFLLFGPGQMVTRAVELTLQRQNMKFFFILLSASRSLRFP